MILEGTEHSEENGMKRTALGKKQGNTFSQSPLLEIHKALLVVEIPELNTLKNLAILYYREMNTTTTSLFKYQRRRLGLPGKPLLSSGQDAFKAL